MHEAFKTPGQLVRHLLEERGWSQAVLAAVLGVSQPIVSGILSGKRRVDGEMALALNEVFGTPAEEFAQLQAAFELATARVTSHPQPERARRAQLFAQLPVSEMIERGWIEVKNPRNAAEVELAVTTFFGVGDPNEIVAAPHAAKRSDAGHGVTPVQMAWIHRVRSIARNMLVPTYSTDALCQAIDRLAELRISAEGIRHVPRILMEAGVRFLIVEALPGSKIDGVCLWLDKRSPVIALSMRFDRIDNFWFVLRHECEHVLRGHGLEVPALDAELEGARAGIGADVDADERVANEAASSFCVPRATMQQFIDRKAPLFAERDVLAFAKYLKIHPGLVAGQLQHLTNRYDRFRAHLTAVRCIVLPNVLHDGWGDVVPRELTT